MCTEDGVALDDYIARSGGGFVGMFIKDTDCFFESTNDLGKTTPEERLKFVKNFKEITKEDLTTHLYPVHEFYKKVLNVGGKSGS